MDLSTSNLTEGQSSFILSSNDMSININEIASALSKAQVELQSVTKNEKGFGYNYSSLASTIDTVRETLGKYNLAVTQLTGNSLDGKPQITTILMHSSGQFIKSVANMPLIEMKGVNEAQRAGAVYSYLRRYALQAILNLASEDNDASSNGMKKPENKTSFSEKKPPQKFRRENVSKKDHDDI